MLAAWACMAVYYLRGRGGIPFMSVIAALQCIQPYTDSMITMGKKRILGTLVGAAWGSAVLYMQYLLGADPVQQEVAYFAMIGAFAGAVIYSTVVLNITDSAYFSAVVFLGIAMNHVTDMDPSIYIVNRVIDTVIGVFVGILVNSLHLPRLRREDILFISGIDPILSGEENQMSPYTKVELNRLVKDGARFTVVTKQAPAMVNEVLSGVRLPYPVIAMDGAVMVDMNTRTYLFAEKMDASLGREVEAYMRGTGVGYLINTIEDNLLVSSYHKMEEGPLKNLLRKRRRSLYRNFVHTDHDVYENVVNFMTIGREAEVRAFGDELMKQPFARRVRTGYDTFGCEEGELILRIFSVDATRDRTIRKLKEQLGTQSVVKFGLPESAADEVLTYTGNRMVREIKKRFETVDIRGWKNMLHV